MAISQSTPPTATPRRVKIFIAAIAIWLVTYVAAVRILDYHIPNPWIRGGVAALGICGFLVWMAAAAFAIRSENEFNRRVYLIGTACAFAVSATFVFACNMLQRAGFVHYVPLTTILLVMFITWPLALAFASRHYL
ncbi:MAG TPA: hypothetical protein VFA85_05325 [Terriglobales bacterium]|nr:hypothetical protein [Terriglobales bacterium]